MARNAVRVVLVAALLVLAGCSGTGTTDTETATSPTGGTGAEPTSDGATGTVEFYISDEPNAIGDFEHLNVTITEVGLHRTSGLNRTDGSNESESEASTGDNETVTASPTATTMSEPGEGDGDDKEGENGDVEEHGENGHGEWVEYDIKQRTVDLTELAGENATKLDVLEAPAGTYDKVFIYVGEINATLTNGERVNVKLPSERLHINKEFTVGDGDDVQFVFDIAPHKAGKSGKYILKPVISQSGTGNEVDIRDVEEREMRELDARFAVSRAW